MNESTAAIWCATRSSRLEIIYNAQVGMGIVPLQYKVGDTAESLGLTGKEKFDVLLPATLIPGQDVPVTTDSGKSFNVTSR